MERFAAVLAIILPIIILMGFGMLSNKRKWVSADSIGEIKGILTKICIPALVFNTFYSTEFSSSVAMIVLIMAVFTVIAGLLGIAANKVLKIEQSFMPYLCTTIEGGMLGYALYILLFGEENLYHMGFIDLGNAIIMFPVLLTMLRLRGQGELNIGLILENVITPINVAIAAGLVINLTGLGAAISASAGGLVLEETLSYISKPTSALILICVGHGLDFSKVRWGETLKTMVVRILIFAVFGLMAWKLVKGLFPGDAMYEYAVILGFALPPTFMYSACTKGGDEEAYVGSVLAVYTVITLIAFCILAWNATGL